MTRAFTLIETVVVIGLSVALVVAIAQLSLLFGNTIALQNASIGNLLGANTITDAVRTAGLQADHIVANHAFSGFQRSTGTTTVIFELPSVDVSGSIISNVYDYVGIYASGTEAYRVIDTGSGSVRHSGTKRLSDVLDTLSFSYDASDVSLATSVLLEATTSAVVKGVVSEMHLYERVYLRNL